MFAIVTKDYTRQVDLDDVVKLIVPARHASPTLKLRRDSGSYKVTFWDLKKSSIGTKSVKTLEEAETLKGTLWRTPEQLTKFVTIREIVDKLDHYSKYYRIAPCPVDYDFTEVPLDPLFLGLWIGDGSSTACHITTADKEILDYMEIIAQSYGLCVKHLDRYTYSITSPVQCTKGHVMEVSTLEEIKRDLDSGNMQCYITKKYHTGWETVKKYLELHASGKYEQHVMNRRSNPISAILKDLHLWGSKHIPEIYMKNSRDVRLKVLAGIIDTDGSLQSGGYNLSFSSEILIDDVITLARSLGFRCPDKIRFTAVCTNSASGPKDCIAYRTRICGGNELRELPILLPRKIIKCDKKQRYDMLHFKVIPTPRS